MNSQLLQLRIPCPCGPSGYKYCRMYDLENIDVKMNKTGWQNRTKPASQPLPDTQTQPVIMFAPPCATWFAQHLLTCLQNKTFKIIFRSRCRLSIRFLHLALIFFRVSLRLQRVPSEWCCWRTCPRQTNWRGHTCIEAAISRGLATLWKCTTPLKYSSVCEDLQGKCW